MAEERSLPATMTQAELTRIVRGLMGRAYPLNSSRIGMSDEVVVEDDEGGEWVLTVSRMSTHD